VDEKMKVASKERRVATDERKMTSEELTERQDNEYIIWIQVV
jgi:hypothetical protein